MIDDLATYDLVHFLPFTAEVYDRIFTLHNEAWWPAQLVAVVFVLAMTVAAARRHVAVVGGLLAVAWSFVAAAFFEARVAELLWASSFIAAAFVAQAVLTIFAARSRLELIRPRAAAAGFSFVAIVWVLLTPAFGRSWAGVEVYGLTPDPTALATLALLAGASRRSWFLWPIPVAWCAVSAATSYALISA